MKKSIKGLSTKAIQNVNTIKGGNNIDDLISGLGGSKGLRTRGGI